MPAEPVEARGLAYLETTSKVIFRHVSKHSGLARRAQTVQIMPSNKGGS